MVKKRGRPRKSKTELYGHRLTFAIDTAGYDRLTEYTTRTGTSTSDIIRNALEAYITADAAPTMAPIAAKPTRRRKAKLEVDQPAESPTPETVEDF